MKIIKVKDQLELVPTSQYKYGKFPFSHFNQVQSRVFEYHEKDVNYVVAAPTSVGKTICSEVFIGHTICEQKRKALYLAPLKSLAQEKMIDWAKSFGKMKVAICTGDYRLTADRKKELAEADIIIMTCEMLNSKSRNFQSEQNDFLKDVGVLVVDEVHTLTVPNRGSHLESGIMKFTEINPSARLVFLSATMPNVDEIGEWAAKLTKRTTIVQQSTYRPCPLFVHYVKYYDTWSYDENEVSKMRTAIKIYDEHPQDKFIMFVHTKRLGNMLLERLKELGIQAEYHNADIEKEKRLEIERKFKEDSKLRVLVATSTVAAGINMPARRVIILGIHRGLTEVETFEIDQECGRAGRPQYDSQGDAYVLLPSRSFDKQKERLQNPQLIHSQMSENKCLAFHLTSDIHHRSIQSKEDICDWYERSLAHHQDKELDTKKINEVINNLTKCGAVKEEEGCYETTSIGNIASMFYFSPYDISDLYRNWSKVFDNDASNDDYWAAMALANIDSFRMAIASNADKEEMSKFRHKIHECEEAFMGEKEFTDGVIKTGCCYYNLMNGKNSLPFNAVMTGLKMDFERISEVLCVLDQMKGKWRAKDYFNTLHLRILYGVEAELVELCRIRGIGRVKAKRLWDGNVRTLKEVSDNVLGVIKSLNCSKKVAEEISCEAKTVMLARRC